jgi:DNA repair protein RecO (recombination protein O)
MHWNETAIILSVRKLGEHSGVIHLLSPSHGLYGGVDRGAFSKRKRGLYQPGNIVNAKWQARLPEQLGTFDCELLYPVAALLLHDQEKLLALSAGTRMCELILAERDPQPDAYARLEHFLSAMCHDGDWRADYLRLELTLLECSGFGLDLARCAATGGLNDLIYVSPRSGCAVSREAGLPWHDRLFALPSFLLHAEAEAMVADAEILDAVRLCGYFLSERVFAPRGLKMPPSRERFIQSLASPAAIQETGSG